MSSIKFEYNGSPFILEYDRASAMQAERILGISLNSIQSGKLSVNYDLFAGAFLKHHPNIKTATIDAIFNALSDKADLFHELQTMYVESLTSIMDEPDSKNVISWTKM